VTAWAVAAAHNPELVVRRMQELRTVWERTAQEVVVPIVVVHRVVEVVHKVAAEAVQVAHKVAAEAARVVHRVVAAAAPIVVVHKVVEVARMAAVVVDSDLAAAVGLDHKT
jgi:hypothetical protein